MRKLLFINYLQKILKILPPQHEPELSGFFYGHDTKRKKRGSRKIRASLISLANSFVVQTIAKY